MRVLVAHNAYHYRGGEDTVVDAEVDLLRRHGHLVLVYRRDNAELEAMKPWEASLSALWSKRTVSDMNTLCADFRPDILHAHNTFPLISPSLYGAAKRHKVPVIQTLHNFRLVCPQAMLVRQGHSCLECIGHLPWRGVLHRCYRDSLAASTVVAAMVSLHRVRGTWSQDVSRYIVLNHLCREIFIQGGLPAEKLCIKPNFVRSERFPDWHSRSGGLFIGRLSSEKGLDVLIRAMQRLPRRSVTVYGQGPMQAQVKQAQGLIYGGFQQAQMLTQRLHEASWLVMPSTGIESFGLVAIEAFACGTPVIASRQGGLLELVEHGKTGLLVTPGDAEELASAMEYAETHPQQMRAMGRAAWQAYWHHYTPERNYEQLMGIYQQAISPLPSFLDTPHAQARSDC